MGLEAIVDTIALIIGIVAGIIGIIRFIFDVYDLWPPKKPPRIEQKPPLQRS